jgi:hypothetical protein
MPHNHHPALPPLLRGGTQFGGADLAQIDEKCMISGGSDLHRPEPSIYRASR